ncbi:hypothetical protein OCUBac02_21110 [Bosea sp. ANAM02]|nr:hypothetical protein OCUBac02_21110 [Bosea sp. ANAM02]
MNLLLKLFKHSIHIGIDVRVISHFPPPIPSEWRGVIDQFMQRLLLDGGVRQRLVENPIVIQPELDCGSQFGAHAPVSGSPQIFTNPLAARASGEPQKFEGSRFAEANHLVD